MKTLFLTFAVLMFAACTLGFQNNNTASNAEILSVIDAGGSESLYTKEVN